MNKPQSLRHALNKAVPYVRNNPDKLHLFVDNGSLVATGASSMSWEYRYTLNVVIEDFSGDQNLLMAPVLLWLRDNQPDAINNPSPNCCRRTLTRGRRIKTAYCTDF